MTILTLLLDVAKAMEENPKLARAFKRKFSKETNFTPEALSWLSDKMEELEIKQFQQR